MVFSSVIFLCVFLPALLAVYYLVPSRIRNGVALAGSLLFYAWGAPDFVFILVLTSLIDFATSRRMNADRPLATRRWLLGVSIAVNLGLFLYCKYMNFFVEQANILLLGVGQDAIQWTEVLMPIGISFFTFQKLSYLLDVYRGVAKPAPSFFHYLLYVSLFPQLIAGPIVRYHEISQQLIGRDYSDEQFLVGVWRFSLGLAKKVLIANTLAGVADSCFGATAATSCDPRTLTCAVAWMGAASYAMQLYFDFSGYSDMAIGLGRMLGFHFAENFNHPYVAKSITDFWRRWHISLSRWMREYLYIPLGGNRLSPWRTYINLWIVFLLSGLWHGASWNFIVWGCLHGAMLASERMSHSRGWRHGPTLLAVPGTMLLVLIGWIFFRAWDLRQAFIYLGVMFTVVTASQSAHPVLTLSSAMSIPAYLALAIALVMSWYPLFFRNDRFLSDWIIELQSRREHGYLAVRAVLTTTLLVASFCSLVSSNFNPFIYFRF